MKNDPTMTRHSQHGLTLVELMVGLALGLVVSALALAGWAWQLRASQAREAHSQLSLELRTVSHVIAEDLRRAAHVRLTADGVAFQPPENPDEAAYRLREGVIALKLGAGAWQALTDPTTARVTQLHVAVDPHPVSLAGHCSRPCPTDMPTCPPQLVRTQIDLDIRLQPVKPPGPERHLHTQVHARQPTLIGECPP